MPAEGFIQVHVYTTSEAQIPVPGAAVAIVADDGTLLAARLTNESGHRRAWRTGLPPCGS